MISRCACRLLLLFVLTTTLCRGSKIVLTANPASFSSFSEGLPTSLTVRCALQNDPSFSNAVSRVSSITIRKGSNQRQVARILVGQPPVAGAFAAGANVTGQIFNTEGYLQAAWWPNGRAQAGGYNCEIVAQDADGRNIEFQSRVQIESTTETVADLTSLVLQSQDEIATLRNSLSNLEATVSRMVARHNEQGTVLFEKSNNWGPDFKNRKMVRAVRFSSPYDELPLVQLSAVLVDTDHTRNTIYNIEVRDLTTRGFNLVCSTYWDALIYVVKVQWTSSIY